MRATVIAVAVASLAVVQKLPAQGERSTAGGADSTTQAATDVAQVVSDTVRFGGRTIAAGDTVTGPVVVVAGDLRVLGTIVGTAITVAGDIIVPAGGRITGDAVAALGSVRPEGGSVGGHMRAYAGTFGSAFGAANAPPRSRQSTTGALSLAFGWLVVMLLIGLGVLVFAASYLDGVRDVVEQSFLRSLLVGIAAEIALLPALVLLLIGLCLTLVGILLVPFAIVAYIIAVAGLLTLGFLAVAGVTGGSLRPVSGRLPNVRGAELQALVTGIVLYLGMWIVAALFQWSPVLSGVLRGLALAITYVAATTGLGAAVLSRGGTRRDAAARAVGGDMAVWQTPTPVSGVVAARRPTPAVSRERI